jgi:hypothetical protein
MKAEINKSGALKIITESDQDIIIISKWLEEHGRHADEKMQSMATPFKNMPGILIISFEHRKSV